MQGPPINPFSPDHRGLFTLSAIWHFDPEQDRRSTCRLAATVTEAHRVPREPATERPAREGQRPGRIREVRALCDMRAGRKWTPTARAQPTAGSAEGFVRYTLPSAAPDPSGLLQCDSDGTFRWVTPAGVPLGESRHFTGSMTGVCAGPDTEVRMSRVTGNRSSILVSVPAADPTGAYAEATVRAYGTGIPGVTAVRATCGLLYSGGTWSVGDTSFIGDHQDDLVEMRFAVDTLLGGIGGVTMIVSGVPGLRVDADVAVYCAPSST
ncbi:hypothetical protein WJX74_004963 [Apatococcus lobatus]|uniref:Uncharacterized protein n=1 Tax=Apatococcus lobatus TaxID=904363 RepID=A0AAW1PR10_9CHLO